MGQDTIFALSSGAPPAGLAVVRISGPGVRFGLETMLGSVPEPRTATLRAIRDGDGVMLDTGIVLFFPAPRSFTGEDVAEFQVHGGRAVVAAVLRALSALPGFVHAEPGAFTRRAFESGRADLTEVEGLADLIAAETEMQRQQALAQAEGGLSRILSQWRQRLLHARAMVEAQLDFFDEDDVPADVGDAALLEATVLAAEMAGLLDDGGWGERVRSGFEVILLGAPNVGKSSLLNALVRREAAIVTPEAGTTRDLIEVGVDIAGHSVTLIDTAGLRLTDNVVEQAGIDRATRRSGIADLVLWLDDGDDGEADMPIGVPVLRVRTKADLHLSKPIAAGAVAVSALSGHGLDDLRREIATRLALRQPRPSAVLTRQRQRVEVARARDALLGLRDIHELELRAEALRQAGDAIGRITGQIGVEDMLGEIFSAFCIGK